MQTRMTTWDDQQYLKFAEERTRAAEELLARVRIEKPHRVVDLGCGPGNSTQLLAERWPFAEVIGIDNSPVMLERARSDYPEIEFVEGDVLNYRAEAPVDLLFANALLQWVPEQERLLPELMHALVPGGALAFQVPDNTDEPSHHLMRELPGPWQERFKRLRQRPGVGSPAFYYDQLCPHAEYVDIWRTTYEHVMNDTQDIVEWLKGTALRPYLEVLDAQEQEAYLSAYKAALEAAYPARRDGKRLFSFPRLFVVAVRRG